MKETKKVRYLLNFTLVILFTLNVGLRVRKITSPVDKCLFPYLFVNYLTDAVNCLDHTVANGTIITGKRSWNTLRCYRSICMEGLRNTTKLHNLENYYMDRGLNTPPANTHKSLILKPIYHSPQFLTYNTPKTKPISITSLIPTLNLRKRKMFSSVVNNSSNFPHFFRTYGDPPPSNSPTDGSTHAYVRN